MPSCFSVQAEFGDGRNVLGAIDDQGDGLGRRRIELPELTLADDSTLNLCPRSVGWCLVPGPILLELDVVAGRALAQLNGFANTDEAKRECSGRSDVNPSRLSAT